LGSLNGAWKCWMMASVRPVGGSTFRKRIEAGVDRSGGVCMGIFCCIY
jgi:hypothetical protein